MATGSLLVVPMSFIVDIMTSQARPNAGSILGALMICVGFLFMELPVFQYIRKRCGLEKTILQKDQNTICNEKKTTFSNLWNCHWPLNNK